MKTTSAPAGAVRVRAANPTGGNKDPRTGIPPAVWIATAGAVIFLIGIGYGLKVSIERGWFAPPLRVLAGAVAGIVLASSSIQLFRRDSKRLGVALLLAGVGAWNASLFYGSHPQMAGLFSPWLGLGGTLLATFFAGVLGARMRSDGAMAVAVLGALNALLSFNTPEHQLWFSLTYLLVVVSGQLSAYYLTQSGGRWIWSRLAGLAGTCLAALFLVSSTQGQNLLLNAVLAGMIAAGLLVMAWLPAHKDIPWAPGAATVVVQISLGANWFAMWRRTRFQTENFSIVLILLGCMCLALLRPARRRVGHERHDLPLFFLFTGFIFVGTAVALDWRWVSLVWGTIAALTARAFLVSATGGMVNARALGTVAQLASIAASAVCVAQFVCRPPTEHVFLNPVFIGGALTSLAWGQLAWGGLAQSASFLVMEVLSVNLLAFELARAFPNVQVGGLTMSVGGLMITVVYAAAGASQWLTGIRINTAQNLRWPLRLAGYSWLAAAVLKLLMYDLDGADLLLRAAATLAVGTIFIGAALWANHNMKRNLAQDS